MRRKLAAALTRARGMANRDPDGAEWVLRRCFDALLETGDDAQVPGRVPHPQEIRAEAGFPRGMGSVSSCCTVS